MRTYKLLSYVSCVVALCFALDAIGAMPTDAKIKAAAANPTAANIRLLMANATAAEQADIATQLVQEALALGGTAEQITERLALVAAGAVTASGDNAVAVATAIVTAAGSNYAVTVVAAIAEAVTGTPNAQAVIDAAVAAAPVGDVRAAALAASTATGITETLGSLADSVASLAATIRTEMALYEGQ